MARVGRTAGRRFGSRSDAAIQRNLFYTGNTRGKRLVVLQKPRRQALVEAAIRWYNYPEYQAIVPIRHANSNTRAACLIGA
jgi:uncharacterized protein (DUF1330 family)